MNSATLSKLKRGLGKWLLNSFSLSIPLIAIKPIGFLQEFLFIQNTYTRIDTLQWYHHDDTNRIRSSNKRFLDNLSQDDDVQALEGLWNSKFESLKNVWWKSAFEAPIHLFFASENHQIQFRFTASKPASFWKPLKNFNSQKVFQWTVLVK